MARQKNRKLSTLTKAAQKAVNDYVRRRDDLGGFFICMACGEKKPMSSANAGHFFCVGDYKAVRFEPDNIWTCCIRCNWHKAGNLIPYRENLIKRIGPDRFKQLESLAKIKGFKYSAEMLEQIIKRFNDYE